MTVLKLVKLLISLCLLSVTATFFVQFALVYNLSIPAPITITVGPPPSDAETIIYRYDPVCNNATTENYVLNRMTCPQGISVYKSGCALNDLGYFATTFYPVTTTFLVLESIVMTAFLITKGPVDWADCCGFKPDGTCQRHKHRFHFIICFILGTAICIGGIITYPIYNNMDSMQKCYPSGGVATNMHDSNPVQTLLDGCSWPVENGNDILLIQDVILPSCTNVDYDDSDPYFPMFYVKSVATELLTSKINEVDSKLFICMLVTIFCWFLFIILLAVMTCKQSRVSIVNINNDNNGINNTEVNLEEIREPREMKEVGEIKEEVKIDVEKLIAQ